MVDEEKDFLYTVDRFLVLNIRDFKSMISMLKEITWAPTYFQETEN